MTAKIIDGKQIANEIILEIKKTISKATMKGEKPPGLAVIQVGKVFSHVSSRSFPKHLRTSCFNFSCQLK
jgi:5,10-methylene-tetrahydrofolate dehydrogenase/methenyl tetrahydrofolate cyclohydrolase